MRRAIIIILLNIITGMSTVICAAITPNQFKKGSDSDRIEAAIIEALKTGENSIEIPRMNQKKNKAEWLIDRAIVLPSNFTLVLKDCLVRLADGVQDNIITNAGARTIPLSENRNIHVVGIGNAVLSGGLRCHWEKAGDHNGYKTIGILFYNTKHFGLDRFKMEETQAWAISVENGCAYGRITNIEFNNTDKYPCQDGVDIRKGCHDILIENITGVTGDDVIALTALRDNLQMHVGGSDPTANDDIYNIIINNVQAKVAGGHSIIRLLNHDGIKMDNIFVSNIMDTSIEGEFPRVTRAAIRIGDNNYSSVAKNKLGETSRVFINNVSSRGVNAISIQGTLINSVIKGVIAYTSPDQPAVKITGLIESVSIEAFKY
jgi:hypothetical protein